MMYPYPEHVAPALVLLIGALISQFEAAVPGATLKVLEGHRPNSVQAAYYAQGRTTPGPIITKARPGESKHNLDPARAVDVVVLCKGKATWSAKADCDGDGVWDYLEMGEIAEGLGLVWGGRWKRMPDAPHVELKR